MAETNSTETKQYQLKELFNQKEAAKAILNDFADRQRNQQITKLDQLLKRLDDQINRGAAIQVFRTLEEIGCGKFIEGRKGHPTRFVWDDDLITVGRAARGEAAKIESLNNDDDVEAREDRRDVEHVFRLRPDYPVRVRLPDDFNEKEAQRLGDFLRTLPV
ncbi:MAG: hypothetical protein ABSD63_08655 [Candidatus Korobacteraceae bacterium]|jgi:hypothetical protein